MINKNTIFRCILCTHHTTILHEVFPGRGNRKPCIEYNVQVPLCPECHTKAHATYSPNHEKRADDYAKDFCEYLGVDYWSAYRAIHQKSFRTYLDGYKSQFKQKIMSLTA